MIKETLDILQQKGLYKITITKICDECGKENLVNAADYIKIKRRRNLTRDLCISCGTKGYYKENPQKIGPENPRWKGGVHGGTYKYVTSKDQFWPSGKRKVIPEHRLIYELHTGVKLTSEQKIHHINLNKIDNRIENLYLCNSMREHRLVHDSLQKAGLPFLNHEIWFNRETNLYSTDLTPVKIIEWDLLTEHLNLKKKQKSSSQQYYYFFYISNHKNSAGRKYSSYKKYLHTYVVENYLGRSLFRNEVVHHIDGNTLNNNINNLAVMTNTQHSICHVSLEMCALSLYKRGLIYFDKDSGKYVANSSLKGGDDE